MNKNGSEAPGRLASSDVRLMRHDLAWQVARDFDQIIAAELRFQIASSPLREAGASPDDVNVLHDITADSGRFMTENILLNTKKGPFWGRWDFDPIWSASTSLSLSPAR